MISYLLFEGDKSIVGLIKSALPVIYDQYWFITGYVGVCFFFPYINMLIKQIDKEELRKLLSLLFATMSVIPFLFNTSFILSDFMWFVFMYCVGAYLRKYGTPQILKKNKHFILLGDFALLCGLVIVLHCIGDLIPLCRSHATYFNAKESPLILILVIVLFVTIMGLELKSKWINRIGGYTMGVYLFHENPYVRYIIWNHVNNEQYHNSVISLIMNSVVVSVGVFIVGLFIDVIISSLNTPLVELFISAKKIALNEKSKRF